MLHVRMIPGDHTKLLKLAEAKHVSASEYVRDHVRSAYDEVFGSGARKRISVPWQAVFIENMRVAQNPSMLGYGIPPALEMALWDLRKVAKEAGQERVLSAIGAYELNLSKPGHVDSPVWKKAFTRSYDELLTAVREWLHGLS